MAVAEREVEAVGDGDGAAGKSAGYVDRELRLCQAQIGKGVLRPPVAGQPSGYRTSCPRESEVSHPGFDAVLVPWPSGPEKETVCHGSSPEVLR